MFQVNISPSLLGCRESNQAGCYERSSALVGIFSAHVNTGVGVWGVGGVRTLMLDVTHLASVTRNEARSTHPLLAYAGLNEVWGEERDCWHSRFRSEEVDTSVFSQPTHKRGTQNINSQTSAHFTRNQIKIDWVCWSSVKPRVVFVRLEWWIYGLDVGGGFKQS